MLRALCHPAGCVVASAHLRAAAAALPRFLSGRNYPSKIGASKSGTVKAARNNAGPEEQDMLDRWVSAKRQRDFDTADRLREQLRASGIEPDQARPAGGGQHAGTRGRSAMRQRPAALRSADATAYDRRKSIDRPFDRRKPRDTDDIAVFVKNVPSSYEWHDLKDLTRDLLEEAGFECEIRHANVQADRGFGVVKFGSIREAEVAALALTGADVDGKQLVANVDSNLNKGGRKAPEHAAFREKEPRARKATADVDARLDEWVNAKRAKDFDTADRIRAQLRAEGVEPEQSRPPTGKQDRNRGRSGSRNSDEIAVFVSNIPNSYEWMDLKDLTRDLLEDAGFGRADIKHANVARHPDGKSRGFGVVKLGSMEEAEAAVLELDGVNVEGRQLEAKVDLQLKGHGKEHWESSAHKDFK